MRNIPSGPYHVTDFIVRNHASAGKSELPLDIVGVKMRNGPAQRVGAAPAKFWNIAESADDADEGVITLYGDVMSQQPTDWWTGEPEPGLFITPAGFMEDLAAVKGKGKITVKLNSCGGDLYSGIAIHNAIKALNATTTVVVEGIAASAASVIMCAGDTVQVWPGSIVMIHGVSVGLCDYFTTADLKQIIKANDAAEKAIAAIYEAKTGTDAETLRSMMSKETWMTGAEAVEKGFANELLDGDGPDVALLDGKEILMVAGVQHSIKGLHVPDTLNIKRISPAAAAPKRPAAGAGMGSHAGKPGDTNEGGRPKMTLEELKAQDPELVQQVENAASTAAITAERQRLQAIDEIAPGIGDEALISEAKFGEHPCSAAELALKAMQKAAKQGTKFLNDHAADGNESGAEGVQGNPSNPNDPGSGGVSDEEQIKAAVTLFNKTR